MSAEALRRLPPIGRVMDGADAAALAERFGRAALLEAVRHEVDTARHRVLTGEAPPSAPALLRAAAERLDGRSRPHLRRVINATGIVLHTNLGRAPLAPAAVAAVTDVASGYCNLEFDLPSGTRGGRLAGVEALLGELTGAAASVAVNNGAAAILLALAACGEGGEIVVSRGELVEIGGGFRIPDVIRQGGSALVEVGSTNKTRPADYRAALTERTRVLLKVHQSNFRLQGFTAEASLAELAPIAREHGALLVADLGSGLLHRTPGFAEPTLREALEAGADVVTCSGDKLLGGPQAGLILGAERSIARVRRHPLMRALRLDKMSIAALEATLRLHRDAPEGVPVRAMLAGAAEALRARAERAAALLGAGEIVATEGFAGGGALPEERMASWALALDDDPALAAALRTGTPAVVGRLAGGRLLLDMLAVADGDVPELVERVIAARATVGTATAGRTCRGGLDQ